MDNDKTYCIYKITNLQNGKVYIGETCNFSRRMNEHRSRSRNINYKSELYNDMRKHGENNFSFEELEICNKKQSIEREAYYIKKYNSFKEGYNRTPYSSATMIGRTGKLNPFYGKTHTEKTLDKISVAHLGKKHTNETKAKMSKSRNGKIFTNTHKANISKSKMGGKNGMSKSISLYNLDFSLYKKYNSLSEAYRDMEVSKHKAIKSVQEKIPCKGYYWIYDE